MITKTSVDRLKILSPKRNSRIGSGRSTWYRYYAGFSPEFAKGLIESSGLCRRAQILDPWNGSGTTTTSAAGFGYRAIGSDLNPVMVVVAKAQLLSSLEKSSILPLASNIAKKSRRFGVIQLEDDPLLTWLSRHSVLNVRKVELALQQLLLKADLPKPLRLLDDVERLSCLASFFYLGVFRTLRRVLKPFMTSNPTWIKRPRSSDEAAKVCLNEVLEIFKGEISSMVTALNNDPTQFGAPVADAQISVASSDDLPLRAKTVDMVVTSPPYCTRLDYAVATMAELALLGYHPRSTLRGLRERLIGAATVPQAATAPSNEWGLTCNRFLDRLAAHPSKASLSYYLKNHVQYFDAVFRSLGEISRTMKPDASCIVVVQDSHYKDIHNDLPKIFSEMASSVGLSLKRRVDFRLKRTIAGIHPMVRQYRERAEATESVLCFVNQN